MAWRSEISFKKANKSSTDVIFSLLGAVDSWGQARCLNAIGSLVDT